MLDMYQFFDIQVNNSDRKVIEGWRILEEISDSLALSLLVEPQICLGWGWKVLI